MGVIDQEGDRRSAGGRDPTSRTVLVVDDEEAARTVIQLSLESYGMSVACAADGAEAVQTLKKLGGGVAVVVLDLTMPRLSGEETFERLKAVRPEIPILVMSGYSRGDAEARFAGHQVAGFLQKPFSMPTLAETVLALLSAPEG